MKPHELEAVRLFGMFTNRTFQIWHLSGSGNAANRATIMTLLCDVRMPQARSGVTSLRKALYKLSGVTGNCEAEQQDNLRDWCKQIESEQGWANDRNYGRKTD